MFCYSNPLPCRPCHKHPQWQMDNLRLRYSLHNFSNLNEWWYGSHFMVYKPMFQWFLWSSGICMLCKEIHRHIKSSWNTTMIIHCRFQIILLDWGRYTILQWYSSHHLLAQVSDEAMAFSHHQSCHTFVSRSHRTLFLDQLYNIQCCARKSQMLIFSTFQIWIISALRSQRLNPFSTIPWKSVIKRTRNSLSTTSV